MVVNSFLLETFLKHYSVQTTRIVGALYKTMENNNNFGFAAEENSLFYQTDTYVTE